MRELVVFVVAAFATCLTVSDRVPPQGLTFFRSQIFTNVWRSIARFGFCAIKSHIHSFSQSDRGPRNSSIWLAVALSTTQIAVPLKNPLFSGLLSGKYLDGIEFPPLVAPAEFHFEGKRRIQSFQLIFFRYSLYFSSPSEVGDSIH
ncbi:hypothetical protein TNCV_1359481 [Trichonephila clavipes]|nr:hypothetical protein TNCV_1359481 [Trichonephila clavipes]